MGGAPPRFWILIGQTTSLLNYVYDYPAAHGPGCHTKENGQQKRSAARIGIASFDLSGVDIIDPCERDTFTTH